MPNNTKQKSVQQVDGELLEEAGEIISGLLDAIQDMRHGHNGSIEPAYERAEEFLDDHGFN